MLKKLIGIGMALTMSLTVGLGFANKADAVWYPDKSYMNNGQIYVGKDGHIYTNNYSIGPNSGLYKMYDLREGVVSAVNVYDDTDIVRFSENMYEYKNQGFINVLFTEKNNNDYKILRIQENKLNFYGLVRGQKLDDEYDVHTYKVTWTDDKYVYLYTKNHPNPHEIKLPKEGFEFLTAGDWLWAKVSEETWKWEEYHELGPKVGY